MLTAASSGTSTNEIIRDTDGKVYSYNGLKYLYDSEGKPLGFTSGSYEYYFRYNLQGDVTGLINASTGSVDAIYEYDAHGNIISRTAKNSIATNLTLRNIYLYRGAYGYFYEKNSGCTICRPASMTRLWADSSMRMIRITSTQAVQPLGVISMRIVRIML